MPTDPSRAERSQQYRNVIQKTVNLVNDSAAQRLAQRFGLNILNVTWEDTGRYKNSAVGPNISDMTIQVQQRDPSSGQYNLSLMPVIRHPNFSDETADVDLDKFFVLVGNEKGKALERVSVRELLGDLRKYLHEPKSWKGQQKSLLAPRDSHALVSAQAAFLPIPKTGEATFNPVLFNYQSYQENPAVLTILATREGTSVTVIDNTRDGFEAGMTWGQRLFFNKNGDRTSLTGQRLSDFNRDLSPSGDRSGADTPKATEAEGLNMVLLIQVPLKQKEQPRAALGNNMVLSEAMPQSAPMTTAPSSDVEAAVIGHGEVEGPFTEIDQLAIERDPRFPIRATVQFYKATSNGVVSEQDMQHIQDQISKVYSEGDYVGSLVTSGDTNRPTEYDGSKDEPPGWWSDFWSRNEENTGRSRWDVFRLWSRLRGQ
ncbi:MAG: hypothetical protein HC771_02145 [Synechococcales cyanobacterium CRU_2_2]|nr:hypothetical protein [Synechococcales cyanobacterium CRU_2_2]